MSREPIAQLKILGGSRIQKNNNLLCLKCPTIKIYNKFS